MGAQTSRGAVPGALENADGQPAECVGRFLLQLSLLDVRLHHKYPHAVLAAAATYIALKCTGGRPERAVALFNEVVPLGEAHRMSPQALPHSTDPLQQRSI